MREMACIICGSLEGRVLYESTLDRAERGGDGLAILNPEAIHYRINRCVRCGMVYSNPILSPEEVTALYTVSPHMNVRESEMENVRRTFRLYLDLAFPHLREKRSVLDIGCDIGLLLEVAEAEGFQELYGIEPNPLARKKAASMLPKSVILDTFYEQTALPDEHFNLITLIHVLDHMVDVRADLQLVFRHLKPGGVVLAVVHNVGSLLSRVLGERFPPYNMYHHSFFSKRTLRLLFTLADFQVVGCVSTYNCYSLGFLVGKAPGVPAALRVALGRALAGMGLAGLPITLPLGNIAIVARKHTATEHTA